MALLPVLAVAAVWAVIIAARVRAAMRERRRLRHWAGAMSTLSAWGGADDAGEPWCRLLVSPSVAARLPAQRTTEHARDTAAAS